MGTVKRNRKNKTMTELFWKYVIKKRGCWGWSGYKHTGGYGLIHPGLKTMFAHRASWKIHFGDISEGMCVCHKCDNPECANPRHLFTATHAVNMRDRNKKGRQARGINSGLSKLNGDQVSEIRRIYKKKQFTQRQLAKVYNVSQSTISSVITNTTWNHRHL